MRRRIPILTLMISVVGCATTKSRLQVRFAKEHSCTEEATHVTELSATQYHVSGCGQVAEYVCPSFASGGEGARACEEQGVNKKPGGEPKALPGPNSPPQPPGPTGP